MADLISRQAAIDALCRYSQPIDNGDGTATIRILTCDGIKEVLEALPPVQPEGQWIPVTPETMPKAGEIVLVTLPEHVGENGEKYYSGVISAYYIDLGDGWWFRSDGVNCGELGGCGATPIAWMPKPKPWKGAMRHEGDD